MVKIRIEGTETEVREFAEMLKQIAVTESNGRVYPNRGNSDRGRLYVDVIAIK